MNLKRELEGSLVKLKLENLGLWTLQPALSSCHFKLTRLTPLYNFQITSTSQWLMATASSVKALPRARDERNHDHAIEQATLLQQRKDTELQVLEALEELVDFPNDPDTSPFDPDSSVVSSFRKLVAPFQISDYDALLQERNIIGKCGYVFCPRSYSRETTRLGKYELLRDGTVVEKGEVRKWCSRPCARRAMFIKVQLSEVPAWERQGGLGNQIEVLREDDELKLDEKMKSMSLVDEEDELRSAMQVLALDRGDSKKSARPRNVLRDDIQEKHTPNPAKKPDAFDHRITDSIEGYVPHASPRTANGQDDDEWSIL